MKLPIAEILRTGDTVLQPGQVRHFSRTPHRVFYKMTLGRGSVEVKSFDEHASKRLGRYGDGNGDVERSTPALS